MTKEEIQAEAEKYTRLRELLIPNLMNMPLIKNELISLMKGVFVEAVESDTARKHWEPKWIETSERLPTDKDEDENGEVLVKSTFGSCKIVTRNAVERHSEIYIKWMPLPTFND